MLLVMRIPIMPAPRPRPCTHKRLSDQVSDNRHPPSAWSRRHGLRHGDPKPYDGERSLLVQLGQVRLVAAPEAEGVIADAGQPIHGHLGGCFPVCSASTQLRKEFDGQEPVTSFSWPSSAVLRRPLAQVTRLASSRVLGSGPYFVTLSTPPPGALRV